MRDRIPDDMRRMNIRQCVDDLSSPSPGLYEACATQDAKMLAHQRLGHPDGIDELMDAVGVVGKQIDHREPDRSRHGAE